ncbi:MAG: hypothetical protein ORN49_14585 [Rhodobacteraceae bacterium]|nr:hypothetical protein [Paracoccaceae bacterium]
MWGYAWSAFLIGVMVSLLVVLMALLVAGIAGALSGFGLLVVEGYIVFQVLTSVALTFGFLRLSTMLPGAALRSEMALMDGWEATKGEAGAFLLLSLLVVGVQMAIPALTVQLYALHATAGMVWAVLWFWTQEIVGLSILTTLYGHYVEGRPLV